jgi:AcrR family transcriptional regulator
MTNKEVQKARTLGFFVQAAKSIIEEEGTSALSARKVGKRAGYSYATLYNYFKDMKELLAYCAFDYLNNCHQHLISLDTSKLSCLDTLLLHTKSYFLFFAKQPNVFHAVFIEDLGDYPTKLTSNTTSISVGQLLYQQLEHCANEGYILQENIPILHQLIIASVHGKLLFFMHKRHNQNLDSLAQSLHHEILLLFSKNK